MKLIQVLVTTMIMLLLLQARTPFRVVALRVTKSCSGCPLKGVHIRNADLAGADLSNADLRWAKLDSVNLNNANLQGANLVCFERKSLKCQSPGMWENIFSSIQYLRNCCIFVN